MLPSYAEHFLVVDIDSFNPSDSATIQKALIALSSKTVERDLTIIKTHFKILSPAIKKLQTCRMSLSESFRILEILQNELNNTPIKYVKVREKLCSVLGKNPGYDFLNAVHNYLNAKDINLPEEIPSSFMSAFKYCPITSVDVERLFSAYKLILTDKRHKCSPEHIEKLIVVYCKENYNIEEI